MASATPGRSLLLLLPAFLVLGVILFMPLLDLAALSIDGGSFGPYVKALGDPLYVRVIGQTFQIALISTGICLILAYPLAYFMATTSPRLRILCLLLVALPFWTSVLVRTYAWMVLLGRNGIINRLLIDNGFIAEPLPLIYNKAGVILGTVYYLLPFMVLPIFAAMMRVDRQLLLAAEGLGASAVRRFFSIFLPLTLGGIGAGAALVFILALSAFITPALLGGGRVIMITNLIYTQVSQVLDWPFAAALSVLILVATIVAYSCIGLLTRRRWN
ncbi:ABC transporter permease [Paracoccus sp. S-4012]|uniref:ABC transporter permease n=1 Tax=Paracoccus sp. S-4012 TaxID=2665648 RepID=UPI0018A24725|nr:ABC transporter permease [Paracoccus sp. S-4012]